MAERIRVHDWAATPLGPIEQWPISLRLALSSVLDHPLPMVLCWGPDLITFYNDTYRPLLGSKPEALGRPILEVWAEVRDLIAPQLEQALQGEAVRLDNAPFTLLRHGHPEQAFFNYTLSPVRDENATVVGVLNTAFETTEQVATERRRVSSQEDLRESEGRQAFLLQLSDALRAEPDADAIADRGLSMLFEHLQLDRCFIGFYRVADDRADLPHQVGNDRVPPLPDSIRLSDFPNARRIAAEGTLVIDDFAETEKVSPISTGRT